MIRFLRILTFPIRFLGKTLFFLLGLALVILGGGGVGCYLWLRTEEGQLCRASSLARRSRNF